MATRPKGYGLSRELADKVAAKYSIEDEQGKILTIFLFFGVKPLNANFAFIFIIFAVVFMNLDIFVCQHSKHRLRF